MSKSKYSPAKTPTQFQTMLQALKLFSLQQCHFSYFFDFLKETFLPFVLTASQPQHLFFFCFPETERVEVEAGLGGAVKSRDFGGTDRGASCLNFHGRIV